MINNLFIITVCVALSVQAETNKKTQPTRIVGGTKVTNRSEVAYQVSLRYYNRHLCGASILSEKYVLTAAHCCFADRELVSPRSFSVVAGDLSITIPSRTTTETKVKYVFTHPHYDHDDLANDIAVLYLKTPFKSWNDYIQPIKLAYALPIPGTPCTVSGWGKLNSADDYVSEELYKVIIPLMDRKTCFSLYGGNSIKKGMICAGYVRGRKDSCQGDSGGPLVCNNLLTGVVSWGVDCAAPNKPGVYTDVTEYYDWVEEQMKRSSSTVLTTTFGLIVATTITLFFI